MIEMLYELYQKIFRLFFNMLWWHPTVRKMGNELYPRVSFLPSTSPIIMFKNEISWMKEHKASKWAWVDYICGCIRGIILIVLLLVMVVIEITNIAPRGIR